MFTSEDYDKLHALTFRPDYPGYKPTVQEIPNGDGKVDAEKMFSHVAPKYFRTDEQREALTPYLERAHALAVEVGELIGLPPEFMPDIRYGALRILDYPPGAVSNKHEDFDLFTLMCFRDQPDRFLAHEPSLGGSSPTSWPPGSLDPVRVDPDRIVATHPDGSVAETEPVSDEGKTLDGLNQVALIAAIRELNPQAHLGQLGEAIGLGPATPHEVLPSETRQRSIVYFAIPDHESRVVPLWKSHPALDALGVNLPTQPTVRDWLNERMARSRTSFRPYE